MLANSPHNHYGGGDPSATFEIDTGITNTVPMEKDDTKDIDSPEPWPMDQVEQHYEEIDHVKNNN